MEPTLSPGDLLLVRHGAEVRTGLLVLARFPDGALVVKRVAGPRASRTGTPGWWLLSDNPAEGVDSRHRGAIAAEHVVAVVRARLWPWPSRLNRPRMRASQES